MQNNCKTFRENHNRRNAQGVCVVFNLHMCRIDGISLGIYSQGKNIFTFFLQLCELFRDLSCIIYRKSFHDVRLVRKSIIKNNKAADVNRPLY